MYHSWKQWAILKKKYQIRRYNFLKKGPNFCSRSRSHFELATVQTLMEKNESTVRQCPPFFNQALTRIHCGNLICWRAIWLTGVSELVVQGGIRIRYRPRFFVQVWHQTKYASIGNRHFFTISCNRQTYQNYEQSQQKLGTFLENKVF